MRPANSQSRAPVPGGASQRDVLLYVLGAALLGYVWRVQDLYPILGQIKFVALVSAAAIVIYLLDTDPRRSLHQLKHPILFYALVILGLMVLSIPGSVYPGLSFDFVINDHIKTLALMILLAASIRTVKDAESLVLIQVFGAALYSVLIIVRFDIGPGGRLGNLVYYDANDLGMLIVCTLPLIVYLMRREVILPLRVAAAIILPITIVTIVKTGSRGAFLGFIGVVTYMIFQFRFFSRKARFGVLTAVLLLLLVAGNESYWELMRSILNPQDDYNWSGQSDGGRMEIWTRGVGYMAQRPLLGVGARAFSAAEGTISPLASRQNYGIGLKWSAAHNSFVEIGAELGIFGLLSFVLLLTATFRVCLSLGRQGRSVARTLSTPSSPEGALGQALSATLVGYLIAGFFLSQANAPYMYATYGIILGLVKVVSHVPNSKMRADDVIACNRVRPLMEGGAAVRLPEHVQRR